MVFLLLFHHNCSFILGINPVQCAFFLYMCHLRHLPTWRPRGLQFPSCWRNQRASPATAQLCLTLLALTLLLTLSLSVTTLTCRCVSLLLSFSISFFSFSVSQVYQYLLSFMSFTYKIIRLSIRTADCCIFTNILIKANNSLHPGLFGVCIMCTVTTHLLYFLCSFCFCLSVCLTLPFFDLIVFPQEYPDTNGNESLTEETRWVT